MTKDTVQMIALLLVSSAAIVSFVAYVRARARRTQLSSTDRTESLALWRLFVAPIAIHLRPTNQAELEVLTTTLLTAGRRNRDAVDRFAEEKVATMVAGMGVALALSLVGGLFGLMLAMSALFVGIAGPMKFMKMRAVARQEAVLQALPAAIDLMTTCVDAGLSLGQAISRVGQELRLASPVLAQELHLTASELEAGVSTPDALRRLARRVGLDDLSALCSVIAQASGLGAPVGNTLREFAQSSRRKRMSVLEETAGKLAAQLTIPLAVCLLPAAMLIILGPAVVQLIEALQ